MKICPMPVRLLNGNQGYLLCQRAGPAPLHKSKSIPEDMTQKYNFYC